MARELFIHTNYVCSTIVYIGVGLEYRHIAVNPIISRFGPLGQHPLFLPFSSHYFTSYIAPFYYRRIYILHPEILQTSFRLKIFIETRAYKYIIYSIYKNKSDKKNFYFNVKSLRSNNFPPRKSANASPAKSNSLYTRFMGETKQKEAFEVKCFFKFTKYPKKIKSARALIQKSISIQQLL